MWKVYVGDLLCVSILIRGPDAIIERWIHLRLIWITILSTRDYSGYWRMEKQGSDVWIHCNHLHQWQRHCQLLILFALGTLVIGICYVVYMLTQTLYSMILFSFLHSGSTLVQVVIGTRWNDSDLDIICTDDAAPIVRSWLLGADVNQIFCGHTEVSLLKGMIPCLCISILLGGALTHWK